MKWGIQSLGSCEMGFFLTGVESLAGVKAVSFEETGLLVRPSVDTTVESVGATVSAAVVRGEVHCERGDEVNC